jgi:ribulose 1,5-bisphosphate synthetase/thiazole synthase
VKRLLPSDAKPTSTVTNGDSSNTQHFNIAVVGAGVGGLATAVALKRAGFNVTVYESSPVLSEVGVTFSSIEPPLLTIPTP